MIFVILHNIRSVHNVGSIFRTADAAGVSKIYLTGLTPTPTDRFGRRRRDLAKVALGAEESVPWEYRKSARVLVRELRTRGVYCVAVEQSAAAVDYRRLKPRRAMAFLFGNEVRGLPKTLLRRCDTIVEIPMRGRLARNRSPNDGGKESLNVAVAAGIVLFSANA